MSQRVIRRGAGLAFAASCAAYVLLSVSVAHPPFHPVRALNYFDLKVYRGAARLILNGAPLYDTRIMGFYFTYPPLAAVVFTPLTVVPLIVDEIIITAINIAALVGLLWFALRLPSARSRPRPRQAACDPPGSWSLVALTAAAALWLEPVMTTLGYGQINLVVATLVVSDLSRLDTARTKGAMIGLAAGLKLTPLIFVPYLLFARRRRAASVAVAVFGATIALGFALLPSDADRYWSGVFLNSSRVGGLANSGAGPANQSLRGAIMRLAPSLGIDPWWIGIAAITGLVGLTLAVLASRRGDEATGFSICAITGLLVCPISWTHHWALAVPALLLLAVAAYRRGSKLSLIAAAGVALIGYSYSTWFVNQLDPQGLDLAAGGLLAADVYVLIGVAALGVACLAQYRILRRRDAA